jgi:hypothetical protein
MSAEEERELAEMEEGDQLYYWRTLLVYWGRN